MYVNALCKCMYVSMATGIVSDLFKKAIVHPVYKGNGKDPRDPASYRPVAMLNHRFQPWSDSNLHAYMSAQIRYMRAVTNDCSH